MMQAGQIIWREEGYGGKPYLMRSFHSNKLDNSRPMILFFTLL